MKNITFITLFIFSSSVLANCRNEVRSAAINFRASQSPTNVDFIAETQLLAQRSGKFYYFVQVDVSKDSTSDDVNPWIVKVIAKQTSTGCKIIDIGF